MVYLADDASGSNETFLAATSTSNLQIDVPAGTRAGGRSFVLVYCQNALGRAAPAASVHFTDWALSLPSTTATWTRTSLAKSLMSVRKHASKYKNCEAAC